MAHNHKNVLFLPKLWARLSKRHPDWTMILVGDGCDKGLVEERIKKYHLKNIYTVGFADPYEYYKRSSIFVHPSFSEGFGMVLVEAMSQGCVPIVYNCSRAYPDIINSGKDGFIVPDMVEDSFVDACEKLIEDKSLRDTMAQNAITSVRKFSIDKIASQWIALFEELCPNQKSII